MAGERLCSTGQPITPTRVVIGLTRRWRLPTCRVAGRVVARLVALELGERVRERVLAAGAGLHDVIQVADLRRTGRGLDRGQARIADRGGWQSPADARVVRGVERQLAAGERPAPVRGRVTDRGIDPERLACVQ